MIFCSIWWPHKNNYKWTLWLNKPKISFQHSFQMKLKLQIRYITTTNCGLAHTQAGLPLRLFDSLLSCASTKTWKQGRHLAAASGIKDRSGFELVQVVWAAQSRVCIISLLVVRNTIHNNIGWILQNCSRKQTLRRYCHWPPPALSSS